MSALSPAQIQERRDAARARWDRAREAAAAGGGAIAGGAAGAALAQLGGAALRDRLVARRQAVLAPLQGAVARHKQNQAFIDQRADAARKDLKSDSKFLSTASRAFDTKFRAGMAARRRLAAHMAANSETYLDTTSGEEVSATLDLAGEDKLRAAAFAVRADEAERHRQIAEDLRTKGRRARRVQRAAAVHEPKVESYVRTQHGKPKLILSNRTREYLTDLFAQDQAEKKAGGTEFSPLHEMGIKSIAALERHFASMTPADQRGFAIYLAQEAGLPNLAVRRPKQSVEVRNARRVVPAGTMKVPAYPAPKVRQALRAELLQDVAARHRHKSDAERTRADAEIVPARRAVSTAARQLRWLRPGGLARRGLLGVGVSAGILAGAAAAVRAEQAYQHLAGEDGGKLPNSMGKLSKSSPVLSKAEPQDSGGGEDSDDDGAEKQQNSSFSANQQKKRRTTAEHIAAAAKAVEEPLAEGVGRAFAAWKDGATEEHLSAPDAPGGLFDQLEGPLYDGMAPMDGATLGGMTAPARIQPPGNERDAAPPRPRLINFGFELRSPETEAYAKRYRYSRVRDITDGQRRNIREIIVAATRSGAPPAETARRIRDVIGLTAKQAQIVANYRLALENADPRVLTYTLRDKRFDRTLKTALEEKKQLPQTAVDAMVDAYQRRFLAYRAMTIARTESLRAANNGHVKTVEKWLGDNPDYTVAKTWISTEDERTRPDHVGLHRKTVIGLQTPFVCDSGETIRWPHDPKAAAKEVINCFHPDTMIQGDVLLATRAHYSGPMRQITTRSGAKLTVTMHHPVAAREGFQSAVTLRQGDELIRYVGDQQLLGTPAIRDNENHQPTAIKDIFDALGLKWGSGRIEVGSHDFHGDGKFCQSHVDIVCADRELMLAIHTAQQKFTDQVDLSETHTEKPSLLRDRAPSSLVEGMNPSASGRIGGSDLPGNLDRIGFHLRPFQSLSFGSASHLDFTLLKPAGQERTVEARLIGELLKRRSTEVALDQIVEIRDFHYSGHVYDVQTTSKCVFAQGLLASNCRCTFMTTLIPRAAAARHGPAAYGTPYPAFWSPPPAPYDIDDPDELFGNPAYEPA